MVPLAALIFRPNPLTTLEDVRVPLEPGAIPFDWLRENHPHGCGGNVWHFHNTERIDPESPDYLERPVEAGDVVHLIVYPGLPVAITTIIITAVVTAVISAAISIGLALLFPDPTVPAAVQPDKNQNPSPVYNVRSRQNLARLGEPVPVVYGRVLMTPDLCSSPYQVFESPRGMWIDLLMCLGHGDFVVHEVTVGESDTTLIGGGGAQWIVVPYSMHNGEFGHLHGIALANGWANGFIENAWSSLEVGEQRFTTDGVESGFYKVGRAGVSEGQYLQIGIEWPRGLYQMPDWGDPTGTQVNFDLYWQQCDADGNAIPGTLTSQNFNVFGNSLDPRREQYSIDLGRPGAWLVKIRRNTVQYPNGNEMNEFYWRSLMLGCGHPPVTAYGHVTLLMVRLRADQVASAATRLVRVDMSRILPLAGGPATGVTRSPADAFFDILTNQTYGARRPASEVDVLRLNTLRSGWIGYDFNAVYAQKTTIWEALSQCVQGVAAVPLPVGGLMSVVQDGIRPVRSMMFTEQNIVRGSFQLAYQFEQTGATDGIEIEFVDPDTFAPAYARYPTNSVNPSRINLFGCSDASHAAQFARLQWQRKQRLRRLVTFDTELEGMIPIPGERIAVAHTLPRWGISGLVANATTGAGGTVIVTLDRELPWSQVAPPYIMLFRDEFSGASAMVNATPGNGANQAVLASNPWYAPGTDWRTGNTQERTHFAWGDGQRVVKDFTLVSLSPKGGAVVSVSGVIYDELVYDGTLDFLAYPVP